MKYIHAFSLVSIFHFAVFCHAAPFSVSEGRVEFLALGNPGALKIKGKAEDDKAFESKFSIEGTTQTGTAKLTLESLNTGIDLRDKHMKEKYLEISKFPAAEFKLSSLKLPETFTGANIPFQGSLKLHGVEKNIAGKLDSEKKGSELNQSYRFKIKTADFGISTPNFMGVTMADEVEVSVNLKGSLK